MTVTIDDAYAFHLAVLPPHKDVFGGLKFCAFNVAPFAAAAHVKLGRRGRLRGLKGGIG